MTTPRKSINEQRDRQPPYSEEAECGVLGSLLLAPSLCMDQCQEAGCTPAWFYDLRHGTIYDALRKLYNAPRAQPDEPTPIDTLTLAHALHTTGELETVGGNSYIAGLPDAVPSSAHCGHYLEILRDKWQRREILRACTAAVLDAYDESITATTALAHAHNDLSRVEENTLTSQERSIRALLNNPVMPKLEAHYTRGKAQITGLTTNLEYLDKLLCGLGGDNGLFYIIAARPNVGKTSFVTQLALHAACDWTRWEATPEAAWNEAPGEKCRTDGGDFLVKKRGVPVGISSLEMSSPALVKKMLFQRSGVSLEKWRTGFADGGDVMLLTNAGTALGVDNRIFIDDTSRDTIAAIKAKWRRWHRQYGCRVFILDYINIIGIDPRRFRPADRVQALQEVSAELQALGKELQCPVIVLAQLNRDQEKEAGRPPRMSDLKECGALEQDADVILMLWEPTMSPKVRDFFNYAMEQKFGKEWRKDDSRPQRINVLVAKNRNGPKGKCELLLLHSSTTFCDWGLWKSENEIKPPPKSESQYDDEDDDHSDDD